MRDKMSLIGGTLLLIVVIASMSLFTVDQRQYAIVFQLGEIKEVISDPGLNAKLPFIQNVRYFDKRILTMDTPEPERFITSEKKNVLVDHFVKWRIVDPRLYYVSVAGDEARARTRLAQTVNSGLREEFGRRTVHDVVSGERDLIMDQMRERADRDRERGLGFLSKADRHRRTGTDRSPRLPCARTGSRECTARKPRVER